MQVIKETCAEKDVLRCLIVDDSAFMRFHLRRMMDSFNNIIASEASNGNEAIVEYDRLRPDIVLMDIVMPGLEGVETVRRICKSNPEARIIMVSSVSYQEKIDEAIAAGAKYFVAKPVTTEELKMAIEKAMGD